MLMGKFCSKKERAKPSGGIAPLVTRLEICKFLKLCFITIIILKFPLSDFEKYCYKLNRFGIRLLFYKSYISLNCCFLRSRIRPLIIFLIEREVGIFFLLLSLFFAHVFVPTSEIFIDYPYVRSYGQQFRNHLIRARSNLSITKIPYVCVYMCSKRVF